MSWQYARDLSEFTTPPKRSPHARLRLIVSLLLFGSMLVALDSVTPIDRLAASALRGALTFVAAASSSGARAGIGAAPLSEPLLSGGAPGGTGTAAALKAVATVAAPRLVLTPTSGPRGAVVRVTGVNFPHLKVQLLWDGNSRDMPAVEANAKGEFSASLKIPSSAVGGYHVIGAASSGTSANKPPGTTLASVIFSVALTLNPVPVITPTAPPSAPTTPPPTQAPTAPPTLTPTPAVPSTAPPTPPPTQPPTAPPTLVPSSPPVATTPPPATPPPSPTPLPYPGDPIGYVDQPASNASVSATLVVWGWAIDRNATGSTTGVDQVVLYRDGPPGVGALLGTASYGGYRPDVGTYFGNSRWNNSGWTFSWTVGTLSSGTHTLYVAMHSTITGATTTATQSVAVLPTSTPTPSATNPAAGGIAALPRAPSAYAIPPGAVSVSNSAGLLAALAATTPRDIVLASGVYDHAGAFDNANGHRLYSATLGGAVLRAGLSMGGSGPGNGLVQGVTFDVSDPSKTLLNGIVNIWGTGRGARILDSTFYGHNAIGTAILVRQPEGLVVQRVKVRDFTWDGILVDANVYGLTVTTPALLEDLDIANVSQPVPKSADGRAEACLWIGNTSTVRRALLRNCAWMGLWTGTADTGALHEDLDIDATMVGIYFEHYTTGVTVQRARIGPNVSTGAICEWAEPPGGKPGCMDVVIQDSTIASARAGVYLDEGTTRTTVRRVKFSGQQLAGIIDFKGVNNAYYDNDYSGIAPGAVPISYAHP